MDDREWRIGKDMEGMIPGLYKSEWIWTAEVSFEDRQCPERPCEYEAGILICEQAFFFCQKLIGHKLVKFPALRDVDKFVVETLREDL